MALTITDIAKGSFTGSQDVGLVWRAFDVLCDSSYQSGGMPLSAADMKLTTVLCAIAQSSSGSGHFFEYDYTNFKLKVLLASGGHSHGENTAAAYTQNATTAAAAGGLAQERAGATNLTGVKARVFVIGLA